MAHYTLLDRNNKVIQVIVGADENSEDGRDWELVYQMQYGYKCKRTSYNTRGNQHINGGIPFRGNYAGIGFIYDEDLDVFIAPKPFDSWNLNPDTYSWEAPVPYPTDGERYTWNEENQVWDLIQLDEE